MKTLFKLNVASFILFCFFAHNISAQDTINKKDSVGAKKTTFLLKSEVFYKAKDSITVNVAEQKIFLFNEADITYENINIKAAYIEIDFKNNVMTATFSKDTAGKIYGIPEFKQENDNFNSDVITYNFKTKKGIIKNIQSKEGEGYILGQKVKRMPDNIIFIKKGCYTTCEHKDPHFSIKFNKAKVIPDNKIVSGPALLFIEDIPLPLGVPFGYFPIKKGRQSGILIPAYGESANRGFFLENGGYYWGINDYVNMTFRGDIYSRGSWALKTNTGYAKRYKYNGDFDLNYAINILSEKTLPDYQKNKDFFITWLHNQDPKARPNSRFSANVKAGSSKYNSFNPTTTNDYLSNTFQSSISYSTVIAENNNLSLNLRHSQNTQSKVVDLSIPELSFSTKRYNPFQKALRVGKPKWYENINLSYNLEARNQISTYDSLLFNKNIFDKMNNGIKHNIPISSSINLLKHLTMTNSFNYSEKWYFSYIKKQWIANQNNVYSLITDTINSFNAVRDFNLSSSFSTRLYGMFQFKKGFIRALRHTLTPTASFRYNPDFSKEFWGYYNYYIDTTSLELVKYSKNQNGIYGSAPQSESGSFNFALSNNIEIKVRSAKDTVSGFKKITLIDNLTISESLDLAKDSMKWSLINISGRTTLFKNIDIRFGCVLDPYYLDSIGRRWNKSEWKENKRLFRLSSSDWALSINWSLRPQGFKDLLNKTANKSQNNTNKETDYAIPWDLNISYSFQHSSAYSVYSKDFQKNQIQTLNFNGNINLTKKWKIGFNSGIDFKTKEFSYTSINIYRDLHCWEAVFNWIPTGFRKSYNFTIRVKANVLQDLKLTKKTDWRDSY
ncbi:MAG: LPS-assembly protein LptD [Bacteroidales bacterium]|nr:LPS-assembly protein LptD [Bacteroidales bacterium]